MTRLIGRSGGQRTAAGEAALRVLEHKCGPSDDTGRRGTVLGPLMVGSPLLSPLRPPRSSPVPPSCPPFPRTFPPFYRILIAKRA